jgi:Tol biopolymer transport system component
MRIASVLVVLGSVFALAAPAATTNRPPSLLLYNAPTDLEAAFGVARPDGKRAHLLSHAYSAKSWSPNGRRILAYGGPTGLAILDERGRLVRALPMDGGDFLNDAKWSPDGRWVAGLADACPDLDFCADLRIVRADGSQERTLVSGRVLALGAGSLFEWAPDSRSIAYSGSAEGTPGYEGIVFVSLGGQTVTPEAFRGGAEPSFAPNGKRLAFTRGDQIYTAGRSGGGVKQLTAGALSSFSPSWSPDGRRIAYIHSHEFGYRVDVLDLRRHRVTHPYLAIPPFTWSPDGTRLAYVGRYLSGNYIYIARADGRGKRRPIAEGVIVDWR